MRLRIFAALAALMAVGGCGGSKIDYAGDYSAAAATRHSPAGAPIFGDIKPHDWTGTAPWHHEVHGIDVSRWQGEIDWPSVRAAGISFAFIKATEGGDVADPMFAQNWAQARQAGVPRGAYHFYYFCRTAEEQARWFIRHVPRDSTALPPVLDMEWNHQSRTCPYKPEPEIVRREAERFIDIIAHHYGKRPIVYTTVDFYSDTGIGRLSGVDFWLRSVAGHPGKTYPGADWTFWQYTGTGMIEGITGPVDINAFSGSRSQWLRWHNLTVASR